MKFIDSVTTEHSKLGKECPGLVALHFEDIVSITIKDLTGWKGKNNDKRTGVFGKVQSWMGTVEEQSRGTLHCHFALWIENYSHVHQCVAKGNDPQTWETLLCDCGDMIMSSKMNALFTQNKKKVVCPECNLKMKKCTDQDLRELRTQHGSTKFGEKNIVMCEICDEGMSSKKLAMHELKTSLGLETMNESETHNDCELFQRD